MRVVMLGASGECGRHVVNALLKEARLERLTLLARRDLPDLEKLDKRVQVVKLARL
jgi:uncharacterized protein YbjT (DUF2867 family)